MPLRQLQSRFDEMKVSSRKYKEQQEKIKNLDKSQVQFIIES